MPIKDKDFGKYKRPGIFMEEIDNSIIELPIQNVLINLVPGFSKKGPFNAPIYVTNPNDFTGIFGDDDRRLENKGSFFHKTAKQMLKSGPVWALNLLATNPNRDKVDWKSISVSSQYANGSVVRSAYESFFNRQDFWERDTDAFLNVVKANNYGVQDNERLFHITNMGDKDITVFMFKSDITGFDVTAEEWYGDRTKVPAYIDYREWISDYLVTIIVAAGDWSDYRTLANDTTFSKYYNTDGLMKSKVNDFLNERTITILAKYDCSLIPYFKDLNNRDMYIKNVVNNNTDKTGLFCTYNEDSLLEADFKLGNVDIIGDVLVGQDISSIEFMSYETTLKESVNYTQKYLDSSNNVITNVLDSYNRDYLGTDVSYRTGAFTNGNVFQIYFDSGATLTGETTSTVDFLDGGTDTYYVIGGTVVSGFTGTTVTLSSLTYATGSRYDVLYLTNDNIINILYGSPTVTTTGAIKPDYTLSLDSTIILGYLHHVQTGGTYTINYTGVTVDSSGYIPMGGNTGYETLVTNSSDSIGDYLNIEFNGTSGHTGVYNDYKYLRTLQAFNEMHDNVGTESVVIQNGQVTVGLLTAVGSGYTSGDTLTLVGGDGLCTISVDSVSGDTSVTSIGLLTGGLGYEIGTVYATTSATGSGCTITMTAISTDLSANSKVEVSSVSSVHASSSINASIRIYLDNPEYCHADNTFLLYYTDNEFLLQPSTESTSNLQTLYGYLETPAYVTSKTGIVAKYSAFYLDYYNGIIKNMDYFYPENNTGDTTTVYIKAFIDQSEILTVNFVTDSLDTEITVIFPPYEYDVEGWPADWDSELTIYSYKSNWEQSVEIENWVGDDLTTCNKFMLIKKDIQK